jgi:putative zinc finger protein
MKCLRIDLRRTFSRYLNGELESNAVRRLEDHLIDCGSCRTRLARLRNGHRLAQEMPAFIPERDPWAAIEAAIDSQPDRAIDPRPASNWSRHFLKPGFALAVIGVTALIAAVLVASAGRAHREEPSGQLIADALDLKEFETVNIADIQENLKPHVMTEGYVSEVRLSDEDGDLTFKLVDELGRPGPFIICEIIDPIKLAAPSVGSRVRVYGVSRYDGQAGRNWYEVHPVLNIEVVRR